MLLDARARPARIIATHHESRTPAITYFQLRGTGAIVEEIPERVENGAPASARGPLGVIFSYRLLAPAFAAGELARWAMKPPRSATFAASANPGTAGDASVPGRSMPIREEPLGSRDRPVTFQQSFYRFGQNR
jgi:hypothetical protein